LLLFPNGERTRHKTFSSSDDDTVADFSLILSHFRLFDVLNDGKYNKKTITTTIKDKTQLEIRNDLHIQLRSTAVKFFHSEEVITVGHRKASGRVDDLAVEHNTQISSITIGSAEGFNQAE